MMTYVLEHLFIVFVTVLSATIIGIPLGVITYFHPKSRGFILTVVDIFQTIPSLALLGVVMVFFGGGKLTTIIGLTLYSLMPIVNNTYTGLSIISPSIIEAARGIGMTKMERLYKVMLPLAIPMIFSGIKISTVTAVGTAVFGTYVGGGGLGGLINRGIRIQNMSLILQGMLAIMIMALSFDGIMTYIENRLQRRYKKA